MLNYSSTNTIISCLIHILSTVDGCELASTLCKYYLRKGNLFGKGWASVSSELLMCGRGVCSILLLPLVAMRIETIDVCIWSMVALFPL